MDISDLDIPSPYLISRWLLSLVATDMQKCEHELAQPMHRCVTGMAANVLTRMGIGEWQTNEHSLVMIYRADWRSPTKENTKTLPWDVQKRLALTERISYVFMKKHWPGDECPFRPEQVHAVSNFMLQLNDTTDLTLGEQAHVLHGLYVDNEMPVDGIPADLMDYADIAAEHDPVFALREAGIVSPSSRDQVVA